MTPLYPNIPQQSLKEGQILHKKGARLQPCQGQFNFVGLWQLKM